VSAVFRPTTCSIATSVPCRTVLARCDNLHLPHLTSIPSSSLHVRVRSPACPSAALSRADSVGHRPSGERMLEHPFCLIVGHSRSASSPALPAKAPRALYLHLHHAICHSFAYGSQVSLRSTTYLIGTPCTRFDRGHLDWWGLIPSRSLTIKTHLAPKLRRYPPRGMWQTPTSQHNVSAVCTTATWPYLGSPG
jgi:hypothetical protein